MILPDKRFGQNFLFNTNVLKGIADLASGDVIEIGPGKGYLTKFLLETCNHVFGIEIDIRFAQYLDALKEKYRTFDWILADVLQLDWLLLLKNRLIVGNLPYNIATRIMLDLSKARAKQCLFVIQEEVAQKVCASISTRQYGALSVLMQACYQVRMHKYIKAENFHPIPKVRSRLIELKLKSDDIDLDNLSILLKASFLSKRKKIKNTLLQQYPKYEGLIDGNLRAEDIPVDVYVNLSKNYVFS